MLIAALPDVLTWSAPLDALTQAHDAYVLLLSQHLGHELARIERCAPEAGTRLFTELKALPDAGFLRLLTAPQTCNRLFWPSIHTPAETASFLSKAARAELACVDLAAAPEEEVWTALGDARCSRANGVHRAPHPQGLMPLDFDSPYVRCIDSRAASDGPREPERFDAREQGIIVKRLEETGQRVREASTIALEFIGAFNKVLIFHKKNGGLDRFVTRSPEKYIGLTVFRNPHRDDVDVVDFAEGLVHEGIHTLLDMDEYSRQRNSAAEGEWIRDIQLYDGECRTRSPWTGTPLPVHTYLHACFVWYGLLHFWGRALSAGSFERSRVKERIAAAANGFVRRRVLDEVAPYRNLIAPDLLDAVERMQSRVEQAFA